MSQVATRARLFGWRALTALSLMGCLVACASGSTPNVAMTVSSRVAAPGVALRQASGPARVSGLAIGPAGLAGGNIVANNQARLTTGGAIVANNQARYALAAVKQQPIGNAIVYLTDPSERFYAQDGRPITAYTNSLGRYEFASGVPVGEVVIVNVILADNRREVGFTVARSGRNVVDVSLATTYVTEFLRARAAAVGKTMADFDLSLLPSLTDLTQQALDQGELAEPDLAIGRIGDMNQAYALAVGLNKQGLGEMWAKLLGKRVLAVTTLAGSGESGFGGNRQPAVKAQLYKPKGVARDAQGNFYIADEGNHLIRKVTPDGLIQTLAGKGTPQFSGDGGQAKDAGLWWPRAVFAAPGGVLYVADTLNMRVRAINLADGTINTVAGNPQQANGAFLNDFAGDGGPASQARLAGVRGLTLDSLGNLIFADSWDNDGGSWHHIRRIEKSGVITTLVGVDGAHGFNGDGKPGRETQINYVNQVAVDSQNNIYFADVRNHRVRKYDVQSKLVSTVAGNGSEGSAGDGGPAVAANLSSPYGVALDPQGRLYISERGSRRIRVVGTDGVIRTLAGGGTYTEDGEAMSIAFSEPHDLLLEPDGNLLICDSRAARVRRLWLRWGF
ncbi:MAG: hypothetical protein VKP62_04410 [Candidatus Sericytochromatia bacterium]|nr:hypothetical protein [Candidatus Sericytochromatia bacterium]